MVLSCYYLVYGEKGYLQKGVFYAKICVIGKISIRSSEKKYKTIGKVEMSKIPMVNPLL